MIRETKKKENLTCTPPNCGHETSARSDFELKRAELTFLSYTLSEVVVVVACLICCAHAGIEAVHNVTKIFTGILTREV